MCFEVMFFDLDETLYPSSIGIWQAIGLRMDSYITDRLGVDAKDVTDLRNNLFHQYGTTLRGLREEYSIDESEFLAFVHNIPIEQYLKRDELLIETLSLFPQRKVIFTNADTNHARRVLTNLGIESFFSQVIDIQQIYPYCKPMEEAFHIAIKTAGVKNPANCVMIDDSIRNLHVAHDLGLFTIQVGTEERTDFVDAAILSIHTLPEVIPVDHYGRTGG